MRIRIAALLLLVIVCIGCIKSIADEKGFYDPHFHLQNIGSSAQSLLTENVFKSLRIEVQYMPGAAPTEAALDELKDFLKKHLHKPGGITIAQKAIPPVEDSIFSLKDIMAIEDRYRTAFTTDHEIAVYVLFVAGSYSKPEMLGYAYRNTSAVLFSSPIKENSDKFKKPARTYLEARTLQHEFGHLLGLVNIGTAAQEDHHDADHGKHCTNKRCLMYYLTDTEDYPSVLIRQKSPELDKNCLKDLRANGGK